MFAFVDLKRVGSFNIFDSALSDAKKIEILCGIIFFHFFILDTPKSSQVSDRAIPKKSSEGNTRPMFRS